MDPLLPVDEPADVPPEYSETPVGRLVTHHNLGLESQACERAELLVGTCMDHRIRLRMSPNFAYVIRAGGANLRGREFEISFAIGVGGVEAIAVIGHSDCGMVGVTGREEVFVAGMSDRAGWSREGAREHFSGLAGDREIRDPIAFSLAETRRRRRRYPGVQVAPLHYRVEDDRLYLVDE